MMLLHSTLTALKDFQTILDHGQRCMQPAGATVVRQVLVPAGGAPVAPHKLAPSEVLG